VPVTDVGAEKQTCLVQAVENVCNRASMAEITDVSDFKIVIGVLHRS